MGLVFPGAIEDIGSGKPDGTGIACAFSGVISVRALFMSGRDGGRGDEGRDIGGRSVAINGHLSYCWVM